jgi:predicted lipoprotein with Yx(FWY)xxD motif
LTEKENLLYTTDSNQSTIRVRIARRGVVTLAVLAIGTTTLTFGTMAGASSSPTTIAVSQNKTWGPTLTLKNGDTLYRLTKDSTNKSTCTGPCTAIWFPVLLATGQAKPVGDGVSHLGSFTRPGGGRQVTYEGIPLYRFSKDKGPGQVTGNIKDTWGQWWSINPKSPLTPPKKSGGAPTTTTTGGGGIAY